MKRNSWVLIWIFVAINSCSMQVSSKVFSLQDIKRIMEATDEGEQIAILADLKSDNIEATNEINEYLLNQYLKRFTSERYDKVLIALMDYVDDLYYPQYLEKLIAVKPLARYVDIYGPDVVPLLIKYADDSLHGKYTRNSFIESVNRVYNLKKNGKIDIANEEMKILLAKIKVANNELLEKKDPCAYSDGAELYLLGMKDIDTEEIKSDKFNILTKCLEAETSQVNRVLLMRTMVLLGLQQSEQLILREMENTLDQELLSYEGVLIDALKKGTVPPAYRKGGNSVQLPNKVEK